MMWFETRLRSAEAALSTGRGLAAASIIERGGPVILSPA